MAKTYKKESVAGIDCFNGGVDIVAMMNQASLDGWKLVHVLSYPVLNYVLFIWEQGA